MIEHFLQWVFNTPSGGWFYAGMAFVGYFFATAYFVSQHYQRSSYDWKFDDHPKHLLILVATAAWPLIPVVVAFALLHRGALWYGRYLTRPKRAVDRLVSR